MRKDIAKNSVSAKRRAGAMRLLCGTALMALAAPAFADTTTTTETGGVETVVVTAEHYVPKVTNAAMKGDQPLIETPQAVSVISRDQISLLNWQNLSQSVRYTAGITGENYGSDERVDWLTLRGFNPVQFIDGLQAPVGSVSNVGVDLYGFDSVEVLKGPSSTLYGLAPPGGLVNLTSRRPAEEFGGQVQALYGSHSNTQLDGYVTGPLDDDGDFLGSLTGLGYTRGTQTIGVRSKRVLAAPALTWHVDDATNVTLLSYYQYDDIRGDGGGFLPIYGVALPNPLGKVPTSTNLGDTKYNDYHRDQYGVGYDVTHSFANWLSFEQNVKFFYDNAKMLDVYGAGLLDADFNGVPDDYRTVVRYNFPFNELVRSFNADSRFNANFDTGAVSHNLITGVDYRDYTNHSEFGFAFAPSIDLFNPVYGVPITTPAMFPYTHQRQVQTGLYAEDEMKLDNWVLTAGGRYDFIGAYNFGVKNGDAHLSYRVGLNYLFDSGVAPYIAYATSFQPLTGADHNGVPFKPSIGRQVEGGIKYQPKDFNALITADVYKIDQSNVLTPDTLFPPFSNQTGAVRVQGFEIEGVTRISDQVSINASYSYTDSKVTKSGGPDLGKQIPIVPKNKLSAFVDYTQQTGTFAGLGGGLGVRYNSAYYGDPVNTFRTPPVTLVDAIIHYDTEDRRLQFNASNLFDKAYLSRCSSTVQCFYGLRQNLSVTLTRKF
ncbi:MAG TPA: TonB-dependent siderophore receptor [Rhizomicrobium sp.]|jgi:iron complex outermembrane receptor protein|nr:TonB-dependent siderophore receptor [Rhizomicrobium sp.]